ncbi:hypothetical protein ABW21_db0205466 [Orbilia brochopaga]|nr:hypothetical protein ABW21_db0205466 [Drechslerella brochopaga]
MPQRIDCPVCGRDIALSAINRHLDEGCPEEPKEAPKVQFADIFTQQPSKTKAADATTEETPRGTLYPGFLPPAAKSKGSTATVTTGSSDRREEQSLMKDQAPSSQAGPFVLSSASPQMQGQQKRTLPLPFQGPSQSPRANSPNTTTRILGSDAATADPDSPAAKRQKTAGSGTLAAATRHSAMPLAERIRPNKLDNIYGQDLVGPSGILRRMIETDSVKSMILWGGPGCGKTTIARTIAASTKARFVELSGTTNNVADYEIHRFSKTQQDVFLAPVESGQVILIGATTDPSAIPPLLDVKLLTYLAEFASGDARTALNLLEISIQLASQNQETEVLTQEDLKKALTRTLVYDRQGDGHYDTISAFHKSVRGNECDLISSKPIFSNHANQRVAARMQRCITSEG